MRNLIIEVTNEKLIFAVEQMGFSYEEAMEMMAVSNGMTVHEVDTALCVEAMQNEPFDEDLQAHELASENAWLAVAEYHPEQSDEMYREDMMGGF